MNIREIEDRLKIRELFDKFSILADRKDMNAIAEIFVEDVSALKSFFDRFKSVFHFNGQHLITQLDGNEATAIGYAEVVLVEEKDGKDVMTTHGITYDDTYRKEDSHWKIAHRNSTFVWTDTKELSTPTKVFL